jgi:hypothetical protein
MAIAALAPILQGVLGGGQLLGGLFSSLFSKRPDESLLQQNIKDYEQAAANSRSRAYGAQNRALYGYSPAEMAAMLRAQKNAATVGLGNLRSSAGSRGQYLANLGAQMQQGAAGIGDVYAKSEGLKGQKQQYADTLGAQADEALRAIATPRAALDAMRRQIDMQKRQAASGLLGSGISQLGNVGKLLMQQEANQKYYDYLNKLLDRKQGGYGMSNQGGGLFDAASSLFKTASGSGEGGGLFDAAGGIFGDTMGNTGTSAYDIQNPQWQTERGLNQQAPLESPEAAYGLNAQEVGIPYSPQYAAQLYENSIKREGGKKRKKKVKKMDDGGRVTANEEDEDEDEDTDAQNVVAKAKKDAATIKEMAGQEPEEEETTEMEVESPEGTETEEETAEETMKWGGKKTQNRQKLKGKNYRQRKEKVSLTLPKEPKVKAETLTETATKGKKKKSPKDYEDGDYDLSMFSDVVDAHNYAKGEGFPEFLHGGKIHQVKKKK